jgi:glycosyltransferase involved in cell wall biosynthesis
MAHIVFAHDHRFYQAADGAWFSRGGQFSAASWSRYLEHCERLTVAARSQPLASFEDRSQLSSNNREGVSFVPVPSMAGIAKLLRNRGAARATVLGLLREADLLIARLPSQTGLLAIEVAQQLGKTWAVECVGCARDAHAHHAALQARLYAPIAQRQMRAAIARAPVVSYVTERFLQERYPTRGVTIACSDVDLAGVASQQELAARFEGLRSAHSERPLRFGLIGSFAHRHKGIDIALQALQVAQRQLPAFELYVLGPGDPSSLMRLASRMGLGDSFKPCAPLPRGSAVQAWLDQVDVYLQPSRHEAMPRAVIEAMARACPALASEVGGIAELLPPQCVHPPEDFRRLAEQLVVAAQPAWQREQAMRNVDVARRFVHAALTEKRAAFWQAVAAAHTP